MNVMESSGLRIPQEFPRSAVVGQVIALVCIALYGISILGVTNPPYFLIDIGGALMLAMFAASVHSWYSCTGQIFHPYILFLLSVLLFHGGQVILEMFGLNEYGMLQGKYGADQILPAILIVLICFWAFHLGALAIAWRTVTRPKLEPAVAPSESRAALLVGLALMGIAIVPFLMVSVQLLALRAREAYIVLYQQQSGGGFENWKLVLSGFLVPGALFVMVGAQKRAGLMRASFLTISWLAVVAVSGLQFLLGARSHAVMPLIAATWLWHSRIRKVPKSFLIVSGVLMLGVVFPILGIIRNDPLAGQSIAVSSQNAFRSLENPLFATLADMGGSIRPLVDTLELVPETRPHQFGLGYLHALLNIFPNFIEALHFPLEYGTPESWYVETVDPEYAETGGSWGYSFIAEAYLEFGWFGAPVATACLGAFIAWFTLWGSNSKHAIKAAAVAGWFTIFLHFPRGILESYTRQLIWFSLVPYALIAVLSRRTENR